MELLERMGIGAAVLGMACVLGILVYGIVPKLLPYWKETIVVLLSVWLVGGVVRRLDQGQGL